MKKKLFIIPYAGGTGLYFNHWKYTLRDDIEVIPVEFPGRGTLFKEVPCDSLDVLIDFIFSYISKNVDSCEYAIFGYCINTIIVYELYKKIVENSFKKPSECILCAYQAPNIMKKENANRSENQLIEEWLESSNIKKRDFETKSFLKQFYEMWKHDCMMMKKYKFEYPIYKFECNMILINGLNDESIQLEETIDSWNEFGNEKCISYLIEGNHNFLKTNEIEVLEIINTIL